MRNIHRNLRNFWWEYDILIKALVTFTTLVLLMGIGLLVYVSNTMKYNCNLKVGPSLKTAALIDGGDFAYNPEGFCSRLKAKMENE